ncbi:MAG: four-carbon acid sugar kinase family protein [Arenicellales bacterium]|nr:four-carbon acid sugar kinase family protein [Arenicellales bacterium]
MAILLGAIADDFTGATDLANTLVKKGMNTVQLIGVPDSENWADDVDAVVVALKTRTIPAPDAVAESLAALRWIQRQGARQVFFKYCSTFDSTDAGNIGPVTDALLTGLDEDLTIACPAFPTNGRTVFKGHLFVGDELLSDSGMRNHPLTPMTDSNLVRVLGRQTTSSVGLVPREIVAKGAESIRTAFSALREQNVHHAIVDAVDDADLLAIGTAVAGLKLVTGGSGVALGLPENFRRAGLLGEAVAPEPPRVNGLHAVLSGSCSIRTREQVEMMKKTRPGYLIDPLALHDGKDVVAHVREWAKDHIGTGPVLIYSSADADEVGRVQNQIGRDHAGDLIEQAMGRIAQGLVEDGVRRLIVAGGETSGAVVKALGIKALHIGPEIDPGVPWTETVGDEPLALALKSGNFGGVDFFEKAFKMLS